ncbi:HET-domain-containing protein [Epithele typhae]|uniref:HET-domain-containing protein n=1 Tax=Epithele typhae TaxID=378194 RepID=UPI00200809E8|nr:HET-domain-containing protein [Epithele typhae]KAH9942144.1 HET-domain-containing protein [Epithele typhae]
MWLLSTDRAELRFFSTPGLVSGGYAILSHTWEAGREQSFQELQAIIERCNITNENPRDVVCDKIRQCCLLAERNGYGWVWIDTCCIDKTSSTELSEAINSMFIWYTCAEVCYAYLSDVPTNTVLDAPDSAFRRARWHTRGWTLQELIAPLIVIFLSCDWTVIGDKLNLAALLNQISGVRMDVLKAEVSCSILSVAERMTWAASRSTTRVEDEAYCLMGIFNVSFPTLYGEGQDAFRRLQKEIIKVSGDTSLFAWGYRLGSTTVAEPLTTDEMYRFYNSTPETHLYLLAWSPKDYQLLRANWTAFSPLLNTPIQPYLPWQWKPEHNEPLDGVRRTQGPFKTVELPRFSISHQGLECHLPFFEVEGTEIAIGVLLCESRGEHLGIILHISREILQDPSRKTYNVGFIFKRAGGRIREYFRTIMLGNDFYNLKFLGKTYQAHWHDFIIAPEQPLHRTRDPLSLFHPLHSLTPPSPPFRIPNWFINRMALLGFMTPPPGLTYDAARPDGPMTIHMNFTDSSSSEGFYMSLGTCGGADGTARPVAHWALALPLTAENWYDDHFHTTHDCALHHVADWGEGATRSFGTEERTVGLAFRRAPATAPGALDTLVLHLVLDGSVYRARERERQVALPHALPGTQAQQGAASLEPAREQENETAVAPLAAPPVLGDAPRLSISTDPGFASTAPAMDSRGSGLTGNGSARGAKPSRFGSLRMLWRRS